MNVIAVDLGASNGRVILCEYHGDEFSLNEVNRFQNIPIKRGNQIHWNVQQLWRETIKGIKWASHNAMSIGIDTWGVDFGLLDVQGNLLEEPVHYRDLRTKGMIEWVLEYLDRREIFNKTGIQFLELNTLYQLASLSKNRKRFLKKARLYLGFPDLFNYWLTGNKRAEYTHATTTQCFNPFKQDWDNDILDSIGLSIDLFPEIIQPGDTLGTIKNMNVSVPACHDTGSAVVAVPTIEHEFVYLSSGSWSLMGTEIKKPIINDKAYEFNFTNEGGVEKTIRFLRNLPGLWFEQELMREWSGKGSPTTHNDIEMLAAEGEPFLSLIDPADPRFISPGDMTPRIIEYCREHDESEPLSMAEHIRCVYDSLVLNYLNCLEQLESITGKHYHTIHVIGGGSQNNFLNQHIANIMGRRVLAGPVEASTLGNAVMQYMCMGLLSSTWEARKVLFESLELKEFHPSDGFEWEPAYNRFKSLIYHNNQSYIR